MDIRQHPTSNYMHRFTCHYVISGWGPLDPAGPWHLSSLVRWVLRQSTLNYSFKKTALYSQQLLFQCNYHTSITHCYTVTESTKYINYYQHQHQPASFPNNFTAEGYQTTVLVTTMSLVHCYSAW